MVRGRQKRRKMYERLMTLFLLFLLKENFDDFYTSLWCIITVLIYNRPKSYLKNMSLTLHTTHGNIKIQLFCQLCPKAAKNFLALAASNKYDNTIFHRNIKGFIIQGGDPTGTGKVSESIYGAPFEDEIVDTIKHDRRGVISMANSGPNSNGSQFFITYNRMSKLNKQYTAFGKVIDGFEALDLMEREPVDAADRPLNDIKIHKITIHANPIAENQQI